MCGDDFTAHEGNEQRRAAVFAELRRAESVFAELTFQSLPGPSTTYQDLPWASRKPGRRGPGTEDNAKVILLLLAAQSATYTIDSFEFSRVVPLQRRQRRPRRQKEST